MARKSEAMSTRRWGKARLLTKGETFAVHGKTKPDVRNELVPLVGVEPTWVTPHDFESCVSTNSTTAAWVIYQPAPHLECSGMVRGSAIPACRVPLSRMWHGPRVRRGGVRIREATRGFALRVKRMGTNPDAQLETRNELVAGAGVEPAT